MRLDRTRNSKGMLPISAFDRRRRVSRRARRAGFDRHGLPSIAPVGCPKCGQSFFSHNDDGSCVDDIREALYRPTFWERVKRFLRLFLVGGDQLL